MAGVMPTYKRTWIMQISDCPRKRQFNLPGALQEAVVRDRTLRLTNKQHGTEIQTGDRMYLWSSGIKGKSGKSGRLIAIATVVEVPQPHSQHLWQAKYFTSLGHYDPNAERVRLFCDALVRPALDRADVVEIFPDAPATTKFFRNGHIHTMARVEAELDNALRTLIEGRLVEIQKTELRTELWTEEDLRRWCTQELAVRDGQSMFRKELLLTREARCAFTGTAVDACLQAAHIRPYRGRPSNRPPNGLLLRADVHILFDRNLLRIEPETRSIQVHPSLADTEYWALNGRRVLEADKIDPAVLIWCWQNSRPQERDHAFGSDVTS